MATIWFDMDGTVAGLYSVENWLPLLRAYDPSPYLDAKPIVNMSLLARYLHKVQKKGYRIGIISWGSRETTPAYDEAVETAKRTWLKNHLPSVIWDEIHIVPYDTPKQNYAHTLDDILFDDNTNIRQNWTGIAYDENEIFEVLRSL